MRFCCSWLLSGPHPLMRYCCCDVVNVVESIDDVVDVSVNTGATNGVPDVEDAIDGIDFVFHFSVVTFVDMVVNTCC